jgi:hypothetical protein
MLAVLTVYVLQLDIWLRIDLDTYLHGVWLCAGGQMACSSPPCTEWSTPLAGSATRVLSSLSQTSTPGWSACPAV